MKEMFKLTCLTLLLIQASCANNRYVIETKIQEYWPDRKSGITVEETAKYDSFFFNAVISNTIGKKIPKITVTDREGKLHSLRKVLSEEAIIIASNTYCGFGNEGLVNEFPKAIQQLKPSGNNLKIVCLLIKPHYDIEDIQTLDNLYVEVMPLYSTIYFIDEDEAWKLNLYANPTRLYIDKNQIVRNIGLGISTVENLVKEIESNLDAD
jgi:hypothetical protein